MKKTILILIAAAALLAVVFSASKSSAPVGKSADPYPISCVSGNRVDHVTIDLGH